MPQFLPRFSVRNLLGAATFTACATAAVSQGGLMAALLIAFVAMWSIAMLRAALASNAGGTFPRGYTIALLSVALHLFLCENWRIFDSEPACFGASLVFYDLPTFDLARLTLVATTYATAIFVVGVAGGSLAVWMRESAE